jgi:hypothetical protein
MKRYLSLIAILVFLGVFPGALALYASPQMRIVEMTGQVEFRSGQDSWKPVTEGVTLSGGDWISTGFNARATLEVGNVRLEIRPLTRMQVERLLEQENVQTTNLFLEVGRVRGEVRSTEGVQNDFVLRSPVSTAAVRGTEFRSDGVNTEVIHGMMVVQNAVGHSQTVGGGEKSSVVDKQRPRTPEFEFVQRTVVSPYTPRLVERTTSVEQPDPGEVTTATIVIEWDLP